MRSFIKFGLIGGLLLAAAGCDAPTGDTIASTGQVPVGKLSFIEESQLRIRSSIQLDQKAKADFDRFKAVANAHGAFYVGRDGSGSAGHLHSATGADAQRTAKAICEHFAKSTCVLYATVEPGPNDAPNALPLGYKADLAPSLRDNSVGRKLAIAVAPIGSYGYSWNSDLRSTAQRLAMEECEKATAKGRAKYDEPLREAFQNAGLFECRIHIYY